ncbi:flavin reductase family protein [Neomicrococcus lactis]
MTERDEISVESLTSREVYKLLTSLVIPRPIAWVSTIDSAGVPNLAPHSFFSVVSSEPGIVQFTSTARKDSLRNIEETGEFVLNVATTELRDQVNLSATPFEHGISEFEKVGIAMEPSKTVKPPRVAQSPAVIECVLEQVLQMGNGYMAFGRVRHFAVNSDLFNERRHPIPGLLDPVSRLGANEWAGLGEIFAFDRLTVDEWNQTNN